VRENIKKIIIEFIGVYLFWDIYSLIYPIIGRWSVNWNHILLKLPGTSKDFVLSLLLWTKEHPLLYSTMDFVYKLGFSGVMFLTFMYLLWRDPREGKFLVKCYAISFLILAIIFAVVNVNAPHHIYQDIPREYSPPNWQARPQFVLPSPHCTIATVSFLALFKRREKEAKLLSILPFLVPPATVLLAEHWIWDALTGIVLGTVIWLWVAKRVKMPVRILDGDRDAH
jgi:hypothetical protein